MKADRQTRLNELRLELQGRFREICSHMDPAEFTELVDEMARVKLKYEDLETELRRRSGSIRGPIEANP